ncbi:helix-turn-helix transcriptional regulator [Porcipelethomonas sp.]|uniref:helix-turn-helix domain-containing protein n=1 Tax=Porcipelethomonas sp. TaxID=2981675 RepID=UPI00307AFA0E
MYKLKKIRLEKGLTQLQVQMKTGIDQSDYSKIERGLRYPTVEQLIILSELFGTSVDYLLDLTDVEKPYPRKTNP